MNNNNRNKSPAEEEALVAAYLDGELDAASSLEVEALLVSSPSLAKTAARISAIRTAMTAAATETASDELRKKVERAIELKTRKTPARRINATGRFTFFRLAPLVGAAAAGYFLSLLITPTISQNEFYDRITSDHRRALLAAESVDIAASSFHTVKPWFAEKLGVSPRVPDLSEQGFELIGGRVSVVTVSPTPTVVYRAGRHLVSVFAISHEEDQRNLPKRNALKRAGFSMRFWREGDLDYWAVSDASEETMDNFVSAFRQNY